MTLLPRIHFLGDKLPHEIIDGDLSRNDPAEANRNDKEASLKHWLGGKAASLQRLSSAGLPTAPGFTITPEVCCDFFANENKLGDDWAAIQQAILRLEKTTGKKFGEGKDPLLLAVRSGAAVSMPGMLETLLRVGLSTVGDDPTLQLQKAIKAVFRSWQSPRAAAYRQARNVSEDLGTAVTVQAMVDAEVAGVCFTRDPRDAQSNLLIVEAVKGLGDALVSGDVTPERFEVHREATDADGLSADQALLSAEQLGQLAEIALAAEATFGYPLDLEWAWSARQGFVLLQARPIRFDTSEAMAEQIQTDWSDEANRLKALAGDERHVWVAHNLGESLALPTPLTWSLLERFLPKAFCQLYRQLGYRPDPVLETEGFLELIAGRIYTDPHRQAKLFWRHLPISYCPEAIAAEPGLLLESPRRFQPEQADGKFLLHLPANLWSLLRSSRRIDKLAQNAVRQFEQVDLPELLSWQHEQSQNELDRLSPLELLELFQTQHQVVLQDLWPKMLLPGFLGATVFSSLQKFLCDLGGETEGAAFANDLIAAEGGTFEQQATMYEATSSEKWDSFLSRYGHRCGAEMDLASPRWREDDRYPKYLANQWREETAIAPTVLRQRVKKQQEFAQSTLSDRLHEWGGSSWREIIEKKITLSRELVPLREAGKHHWLLAYDCLRKTLVALGKRWEIGDDIFFLTVNELAQFEAGRSSFVDVIQERRQQREIFRRIHLPEVIDTKTLSTEVPILVANSEVANGDTNLTLAGRGLVSGVATARAVVVSRPEEAAAEGEFVLVCPSTDPDWTPLLAQALALVVERGGALSHGAIIAREFGVPTVACDGAMQRIRNGDLMRVDGSRGVIQVTKKERTKEPGNSVGNSI